MSFDAGQELRQVGESVRQPVPSPDGSLLAYVDGSGVLAVGPYEGGGARVHYKRQDGRKSFMQRELRAMQPLDPIAMASLLEQAGLDLETIETLFENARLNLDDFVKIGEPFDTVRMYDSKEEY